MIILMMSIFSWNYKGRIYESTNFTIKLVLYLVIIVALASAMTPGGSTVENTLETQIDPRLPLSFRHNDPINLLQMRIPGFANINSTNNGVESSEYIANWELYAMGYWYEYRRFNMTCPQLPTGIATFCDWALMVPCLFGDVTIPPKIIFVHTFMLPHFVESTLNFLPNKSWEFVIVSGGVDRSIPNNRLDTRYHTGLRGFATGDYFDRLLEHPQVVHWFAENRDDFHPKFSSIPTGFLEYSHDYDGISKDVMPLRSRALKFMSADRIRDGNQWYERSYVHQRCMESSLCVTPSASGSEISHGEYIHHIQSYPFILCPHGGGIDPSPKAFESILSGTIPIIIYTTFIADSYGHLPVVFINNWEEIFSNDTMAVEAMMRRWIVDLEPYYEENSELRKHTLHKLTSEYWIEKMLSKLNHAPSDHSRSSTALHWYQGNNTHTIR